MLYNKARNNDIHTHTYVIHLTCNENVLESFRSWHNLLLCPFYVHFHQLYLLTLLSGLPVSGSHCLILLCFKYNQSYVSILIFVMINIPFSLHPPCLSYIKLFPKEHDRRGKMNKEELLTANCGSARSLSHTESKQSRRRCCLNFSFRFLFVFELHLHYITFKVQQTPRCKHFSEVQYMNDAW